MKEQKAEGTRQKAEGTRQKAAKSESSFSYCLLLSAFCLLLYFIPHPSSLLLTMIFTRFDRYVDRHARAFTERLQEICRMPSVAARGTGMRAIAEAVEQLMQRIGIGTR